MAWLKLRNVNDISRLNIQLVKVDNATHVLLAQIGYTSALNTHGIGPIPEKERKHTVPLRIPAT